MKFYWKFYKILIFGVHFLPCFFVPFSGHFFHRFSGPCGALFFHFLSRSHGEVKSYPLLCWTACQVRFRAPKSSKNGRPKAVKRCQKGAQETLGASNAQPKTCACLNVLTSNFIVHAHLRYTRVEAARQPSLLPKFANCKCHYKLLIRFHLSQYH